MGESCCATAVFTIGGQDGQHLLEVSTRSVLDELTGTGTVLLRGFQCAGNDFETFTRRFSDRFYSPPARDSLLVDGGDALTTRAPERNFTLLAHNEGSYQPFGVPDIAFFLCQEPPASPGGETMLVDGRIFLSRIPAQLQRRFADEGVIFEACWGPERWKSELSVASASDLADLERRYPGLDCIMEGENLRYRYHRKVIQPDNQGVPVFSNAMLAHLPAVDHPAYENARPYSNPTNRVFFGDGEEISGEIINTLIDIQDEVAFEHRLKRHDLLVIDNSRVMHGRRPTSEDCTRRLLTRFGYLRPELLDSIPARLSATGP